MATSGSIDFNSTRDDIITEALELLGVLPEGVTPTAAQLTSSARTLNQMVKAWQSKGTNLWVNQRIYLFQTPNVREYTLSLTAASSDESTTNFTSTTLNGALAALATAVTLTDGTATTNGDRVGVLQDDLTLHWTTIASGGGTNSIVLTTGVASAAADGSIVYFYTTKAARPRKILVANSKTAPSGKFGAHNVVDGTEIPIEIMARQDWSDLSVKRVSGRPTQLYYDRLWQDSILRIWPQVDTGGTYLVLWCERTLEDFDAASDDADFPHEWHQALSANLAKWLIPKFGISDRTKGVVWALATESLFDAESGDSEGHMRFTPDDRWDWS